MTSTTTSNSINTAKAERRELSFNSYDDILKELDRIVAADRAGKLRATGNWSAGTIFNHLATWIDFGYEGFPANVNPPWFVKLVLKMKKKGYVRNKTRAGIRIPGLAGGTLGTEPMATQEGAAKLKKSLTRLKNREPVKFPSPAFGPMTDEEREQFQCRHAELHMSFLHY